MTTKQRGFFLVLEGLPGSGKTTVGQLLEELGWIFFPEVATLLGAKGVPIGDRGDTSSDLLIFAEEFRRVEDIKRHILEGRNVVVDSYFPTDLSFAFARCKQNQSTCYPTCLNQYLNAQTSGAIPKPDLYVHLNIPLKDSVTRQRNRKKDDFTTLNMSLLRDVKRHLSFVHEIFEREIPVFRFDARKSQKEIVQAVLTFVERQHKGSWRLR